MISVEFFNGSKLSENSKKLYVYSLNRYLKRSKEPDFNVIVTDPIKTIKIINEIEETKAGRKRILTAIGAMLKKYHPAAFETIEIYRNESYENSKELRKETDEQKLTPIKARNLISLDDLTRASNNLNDIIKKIDLNKMTVKQRQLFQKHLIVNLYKEIGARLDFGDMFKITESEYQRLTPEEKIKTNYIITDANDKYYFQFNNFKNIHRIGPQTREPSPKLSNLIKRWFKLNKTDSFLIKENGEAYNRSSLGKALTNIFKLYLNKEASLNSIRHGLISNETKGQPSINQKHKQALKFFHTDAARQTYRHIDN